MPHGTPDWGLVGPKSTTYGLDDLGEHAVRLGSPVLWDRRGDVLVQTDFREGLGSFDGGGAGTGWAVTLHAGNARTGAYCAKLTPGSDGGQNAWLSKALPRPVLAKVGLEFSFSCAPGTGRWLWCIDWQAGSVLYAAYVRYDHVNGWLQTYEEPATWTTFATVGSLLQLDQVLHTGKLVVDMGAVDAAGNPLPLYVRFQLNEGGYNLQVPPPAREVDRIPGGVPDEFGVTVFHYSVATHNPDGYADNVIVTQNEP